MKMKRILLIAAAAAVFCAGCGSAELDMEELNLKSEVLADLVLNNEPAYQGKLVYEEEEAAVTDVPSGVTISPVPTEPPPEVTVPQEVSADPGEEEPVSTFSGNQNADQEFTEYVNIDGLTIKYISYEIVQTISDNIYELNADTGYDYYAVYFALTNQSDETVSALLSGKEITYQLRGDMKDVYRARLNLLTNDIRYLNKEIAPSESFQANAYFLVPKEEEYDSLEAVIMVGDTSIIYRLK